MPASALPPGLWGTTDSHRPRARAPPARRFDITGGAIDFDSGDLRWIGSFWDQPPEYEFYETGLSREARRLGIPIAEKRR